MKYLFQLLDKYIDLKKIPLSKVNYDLSYIGYEVNSFNEDLNGNDLIVGYVEKIVKHDNSNHLNICHIKTKSGKLIIVTGAKNIREKTHVIIAPIGKKVGNQQIEKVNLRGVDSFGMICSLSEVGLNDKYLSDISNEGIEILTGKEISLKSNINNILGLSQGIIDLEILPNRPDVLSYEGLAKELSWKYNLKMKENSNVFSSLLKLPKILGSKEFEKISYFLLKNINIKNNPTYMISSLNINCIKSNSGIEDFLNFYTLDKGVPLVSFDYNLAKNIEYKILNKTQNIYVNGEKFKIPKNSLVLLNINNNEIVLVPGIVTNDKYRASSKTKNLFVDATILDSSLTFSYSMKQKELVKNISRQHKGISSFSRKDKLQSLLIELKDLEIIDEYSNIYENKNIDKLKKIKIDTDYINKIIGQNIEIDSFINALENQEYKIFKKENKSLIFYIPSFRVDIDSEADLIEDYLRYVGINFIEDKGNYLVNKYNDDFDQKKEFFYKVSEFFRIQGYTEIITQTLISKKEFDLTNYRNRKDFLQLKDEYSRKRDTLRDNLLYSLLDSYKYNLNQKVEKINLFEQSKISINNNKYEHSFATINSDFIYESKLSDENIKGSFLIIREKWINLFLDFNIDINLLKFQYNKIPSAYANPYLNMQILYKNSHIGSVFEIHPLLLSKFKINKKIIYSEFNLDLLFNLKNSNLISYKERIKKPYISRFLTITIKENLDIKKSLDSIVSSYVELKKITYHSVFQDDKLKLEGNKNLTLEILYNNQIDIDNKKVESIVDELSVNISNINI